MIEIVSADRCTGCNICVQACPTNVFEADPSGVPRIARQADCQTCFMCELYCPEDALYVAPVADEPAPVEAGEAGIRGFLGSYRRAIGWGKGRQAAAGDDRSYELLERAH